MELEKRIAAVTSAVILGLVLAICVIVGGTILKSEQNRLAAALKDVNTLYGELERDRFGTLGTETRLLTELPQIRAVLASRDGPTIADTLEGFRKLIGADRLAAWDEAGHALAGESSPAAARLVARAAEKGSPVAGYVLEGDKGDKLRQTVVVPVFNGTRSLGMLVASYDFGEEALARLNAMTGNDFAIIVNEPSGSRVLASTAAAGALLSADPHIAQSAGEEPAVFSGKMVASRALGRESGARIVSMRALNEGLAVARRLRANVVVISLIFCLLGVAVSLRLARSISRPLRQLARRLADVDVNDAISVARVSDAPDILGADREVQSVLASFGTLVRALNATRSASDDNAAGARRQLETDAAAMRADIEKLSRANERLRDLLARDGEQETAA